MVNVFTNYSTSVLVTVGDVLNWLSFLFLLDLPCCRNCKSLSDFPSVEAQTNYTYTPSFAFYPFPVRIHGYTFICAALQAVHFTLGC